MKKKIMITVLALVLFQAVKPESFDEPGLFDEYHHVALDFKEPEKKQLSVWAAMKLAPRYVYEAHVKPTFYAMVGAFFKKKKKKALKVER